MADKRPALGKGLSALIPDAPPEPRNAVLEIDVDRLSPNRFQPRDHVERADIEELARSIRANGIIQPILVRRDGAGFQIIAGERRWRAAQHAGLLKVPVIVRDLEPGQDAMALRLALIENLQRKDLNPIQEALGYRQMIDEFACTQEQVAVLRLVPHSGHRPRQDSRHSGFIGSASRNCSTTSCPRSISSSR